MSHRVLNLINFLLDEELGFFLYPVLVLAACNEAILFWSSSCSQLVLLIEKTLLAEEMW